MHTTTSAIRQARAETRERVDNAIARGELSPAHRDTLGRALQAPYGLQLGRPSVPDVFIGARELPELRHYVRVRRLTTWAGIQNNRLGTEVHGHNLSLREAQALAERFLDNKLAVIYDIAIIGYVPGDSAQRESRIVQTYHPAQLALAQKRDDLRAAYALSAAAEW